MWPVWTAEEARTRDQEALAAGVSLDRLMESAGGAVAQWLARERASRVAVLVGPGHNGGDGLVAARRLAALGIETAVYAPLGVRFDGGTALLAAAEAYGVRRIGGPEDWRTWVEIAEWVVDAAFGTGLNRPLPDVVAAALAVARDRRILAVDLPSGVDTDRGTLLGAAVPAEVTVTFDGLKPAHLLGPAEGLVGRVYVAGIGLSRRAGDRLALVEISRVVQALPSRGPDAHKYARGRLEVAAGSERYTGAPGLVARGAMRAGNGYVEVWTARAAHDRITFLPAVVRVLPTDERGRIRPTPEARARWADADAVVVGPGLGDPAADLVEAVRALGRPTVVDADALLGWVELGGPPWPEAVFTPHAGEAARMLKTTVQAVEADRPRAVRQLAQATQGTVLLKGRRTLVAQPEGPVHIVVPGDAALATAGTGDVLAGVIGALLAGGADGLTAATVGAFWHGVAGTMARERLGRVSVTAEDVADALGPAAEALRNGYVPEGWPVPW